MRRKFLNLIMFFTFVPALFSFIILSVTAYKIIFRAPDMKQGILKVTHTKSLRSTSNRSVVGVDAYGVVLQDSTEIKIKLNKVSEHIGIDEDSITIFLIENDSLVPIWYSTLGKKTATFRFEKEGEPFNRWRHIEKTIKISSIAILSFLIPFMMNKLNKENS